LKAGLELAQKERHNVTVIPSVLLSLVGKVPLVRERHPEKLYQTVPLSTGIGALIPGMDAEVLVGKAVTVVSVVLISGATAVVDTDSTVVVDCGYAELEYRFMYNAAPHAAPGSPAQAQSQEVESAGSPMLGPRLVELRVFPQ
jgi:hypothetical protein